MIEKQSSERAGLGVHEDCGYKGLAHFFFGGAIVCDPETGLGFLECRRVSFACRRSGRDYYSG